MSYLTEGSPIIRIPLNRLREQPEGFKDLGEMLKTVVIIPQESRLYHYSKSLRDLLNRGVFDYRMSYADDGSFFFTDFPAIPTNCQAEVDHPLVMYDNNQLTYELVQTIESLGKGNLWRGAMNIGFDGRVFQNPDAYVRVANGKLYATEVVVFQHSLRKLGRIAGYPPGSERSLYRFLR